MPAVHSKEAESTALHFGSIQLHDLRQRLGRVEELLRDHENERPDRPSNEDFEAAMNDADQKEDHEAATSPFQLAQDLLPKFDTRRSIKAVCQQRNLVTGENLYDAKVNQVIEMLYRSMTWKNMAQYFATQFNIDTSERTLKGRAKEMGLTKIDSIDAEKLGTLVEAIATDNAHRYGYRAVWVLLKTQYKVFVARNDVSVALRTLFPDEAERRVKRVLKRRTYNAHGAKYALHVDGGDKLKYWGFPYWLAIDGWSRFIVVLKVVDSNNDPVITGRLWLNALAEYKYLPNLVMSDAGKENSLIHAAQSFLRRNHTDAMAQTPWYM